MSAAPQQIRPRKCRNPACRAKFQPKTPFAKVCSDACMEAVIERAMEAMRARRNREQRAARLKLRRELREGRERLKTLGAMCVDTQKSVNLYVRIRDFGKGCISCDTGAVEDAGHFYPIGSKYRVNRLRFDTRAIHGQCRKCNSYTGGGNVHGYRAGLIRRYGEAFLLELDDLKRSADQGLLEPLTKDEVRSIAAEHRKLARELGVRSNMAACA